MQTATSQLAGVDLMKFGMAFAVVFIHVGSFYGPHAYPWVIEWFINLAVPFFFIVSGFLIARRLDSVSSQEARGYLNGRAKRLMRMFACWLVIYFPLTVYYNSEHGVHGMTAVRAYISQVILSGDSAYAWPLWFIYSMMVVCAIFSRVVKRRNGAVILMVCFTVLKMADWYWTRFPSMYIVHDIADRALGGGIYMTAGYLLFGCRTALKRSVPIAAVAAVASVVMFRAGVPFYPLFGGLSLFILAFSLPMEPSARLVGMRRCSVWVYYIHMYVLVGCSTAVSVSGSMPPLAVVLPMVCLITFILSVALEYVQRQARFRWIGFLVS